MKKLVGIYILFIVASCNSLIEDRSTLDSNDDDFISAPAQVAGSLYSAIRNDCVSTQTSDIQFQVSCDVKKENSDKSLSAIAKLPREIELAWQNPSTISGSFSSVTCSTAQLAHPLAPLRQVCIVIAKQRGMSLTEAMKSIRFAVKVSLVSYRSDPPGSVVPTPSTSTSVEPSPSVSIEPSVSPTPSQQPPSSTPSATPGPNSSGAPMALFSLADKVVNDTKVETDDVEFP